MGHSAGEMTEDVGYGNPQISDAWLAAALAGLHRDDVGVIHLVRVSNPAGRVKVNWRRGAVKLKRSQLDGMKVDTAGLNLSGWGYRLTCRLNVFNLWIGYN